MSDHQRDLVTAYDQLAIAEDKADVRQRMSVALTALVDRIVMSANHNVMIHFKDATVYVLRYRLKPGLPKQKRVGSRPICDFEWYAGRVGFDQMMEGWKESLERLDMQTVLDGEHS